jgi:large subunit ribosomal protein L18
MPRSSKEAARRSRHERLRGKVAGTPQRPRLFVKRTLHHIYAGVVDDSRGHTLVSASTRDSSVAEGSKSRTGVDAAKAVGAAIAAKAKAAGVKQVVFDRAGYKYHGRVRALADAAREAGLEF